VLYLVIATQYSLCFLSMLLTGLFCVEVAHSASEFHSVRVLSIVGLLVVGVGFDLSKYIFWHFHSRSTWYLINCLVLVIFSWSASVAFFVSNQQASLESSRIESVSYQALKVEIDSIRAQIRQKTAVLENRLNSEFHEQWDKAEALTDSIQDLENVLYERVKAMDHVGYTVTNINDSDKATSLFRYLSSSLGASFNAVTLFAYGVLAFLIESCSLGVISLSNTIKHQSKLSTVRPKKVKPRAQEISEKLRPIEQKMLILREAIIAGEADPVIRRIRKSNYHLSEKNIRKVLAEMKGEGLLVDGVRCLELAKESN
jgi:hypothetical protein